MKNMNILAIGAHPDDVEIGMGGTLLKHINNNDKVIVLIFTYGEKGEGTKEQRIKESNECAEFAGYELRFGNLIDTNISEGIESIKIIEDIIIKKKIQRIYTHSIKDTHQDHRAIGHATLSAARRAIYNSDILSFESPSSLINFSPNYFVEITPYIEKKKELILKFKSQNRKYYVQADLIHNLAYYRGYQVGINLAEAFEVIRIVRK